PCLQLHIFDDQNAPLAIPGGDRQSPIDIVVRKSIFDPQLRPLKVQYDPRTCQQIWNNGYSFLVEYDDTTDKSSKLSSLYVLQLL
uniref:Alpha-carbonic anhydrase domain-containing protein n=1 Tax=Sinocyclocheilus rhinocerous TaxID=307959 RepID=A0A673FUQ3_9TELE